MKVKFIAVVCIALFYLTTLQPPKLHAGTGDGSAISFRGFTSLASEDTTFETDGALTLEIWFRTTKSNGLNLFGHEDPGGSTNFAQLRMNGDNSRVRFVVADPAGNIAAVDSPTPLNDGLWHHAAGVRDGAVMRLYIDGQLVTETTDNTSITNLDINGPVKVGRWRTFSGATLLEVDEARLWHTARTAAEIASNLYGSVPMSAAGLVGYWPMAAGSGTTVVDVTGAGNDLAFVDAGSSSPQWAGRAWDGGESAFASAVANGVGLDATLLISDAGDDVTVFPSAIQYGVSMSNLPAEVMSRWAQHFLITVNRAAAPVRGGDMVDITFDISDAGGSGDFDATENYSLLKRNTEVSTGTFAVVPTQNVTVSGDQVTFTVDSAEFAPTIQQITIGTDMDFTAVAVSNQSTAVSHQWGLLLALLIVVAVSGVVFGRKQFSNVDVD